jgi:hypothetical protein
LPFFEYAFGFPFCTAVIVKIMNFTGLN